MTMGIYRIDGPNGKVYIGSSINIEKRWVLHQSDLRLNVHHSPHLQNAYNKYGLDAFKFSIIEVIDNEADLERIEQIWLDILFTSLDNNNIYNSNRSAMRGRLGRRHTETTKAKMRESAKKRGVSAEHIAYLASINNGRALSDSHKVNLSKVKRKNNVIYSLVAPDGTVYYDIGSLVAFCKEHDLNNGAINQVALGKKRHYKGWTRYE